VSRGRIVIVEDERIVALELELRLERMGFDVLATFGSGEEMIASASELAPDLALMDIRLAGEMDGVETAEQLRAFGIPTVFLTAYADDATLDRVKSTEPLGYILKPFEERGLQATIDTALFRHRAEIARREAEAARRRAEARHTATLDSSPDAIITVDGDGRIVVFNRAAERMFGYAAADVFGGTLDTLIPEELRMRHRDHVARYVATAASPRAMGERGRLMAQRRDGTTFPIEASISRHVRDEEVLLTAVIRDVTEQLALEEHLRRARQVEAVGMLASSVVHDVNNLLAVIQHAAELVRREVQSDHLDTITSSVARGAALTRQLLLFARGAPNQVQVVAIDALLCELEDIVRHLAAETVRVQLDVRAPSARVVVDRQRLEQVILNCVANARDSMPLGGGILIRTTAESGSVLIEVIDNGAGIAVDVLPRIFEPFFTTKEQGHGTGLGLWTSREVVREAGGSMEVSSTPGRGTTISIRLPCTEAPATAAPSEAPAEVKNATGTVLVVDDEEPLRKLLARTLELRGFNAFSAGGAGEALAFLEKSSVGIDVLVTDLVLPIMSGQELADRMRRFLPRLRVVYISGHGDEASRRATVVSLQDQVLTKPFTGDELAARVRSALQRLPRST